MNILIMAPEPFFQQRGTPIAVKMLAEQLAAMGHSIELLTYHEGDDVRISGVTLHRIPRLPFVRNIPPGPSWKKFPCDAAMFFSAWRIINRKKIDLIHAVEESVFLAAALKVMRKVPYVYDMDSSLAEQTVEKWKLPRFLAGLLESMEAMAVRQSAGVLTVCRALEEKARASAPDKLVGRLEDVSMLNEADSGPMLREELGFQGPMVLYVGNLERYQGMDLLLESFALAEKRCAGANLVVIGGTAEHIKQYRDRAEKFGVASITHFVGPRPIEQLGWYLRQADVLVSPRIQGNNTPMKIYSYMGSGRPVLATRLPTHTQVLNDDMALLADPAPAGMAESLVRLLNDDELRRALARRALQCVAQEYSLDAFKRKLAEFYDTLGESIGNGSTLRSRLRKPVGELLP